VRHGKALENLGDDSARNGMEFEPRTILLLRKGPSLPRGESWVVSLLVIFLWIP